MRRTVCLSLLMTALGSPALPARAEGMEISCDGSPAQAAMNVPTPGDRFLHVLCTKYGHVLAPVAGWFWTSPGTFEPRFFPAQMVRDSPKETGNAAYFRSISASALTGSAAQAKWSILTDAFPNESPPQKALEIVAENERGERHTIYIFPNAWGYSCSPACRKESAFIMVSQNKESPRW